ncbi:MAG: hypothetical protein HWN69_02065 [Desulfobacterales bacterium]|nr:hypothetical protein [Desulfobacterales bacterium]
MNSPDEDRIIQKLMDYQSQIREMDYSVKQYLSDRENNPHPLYEDLINEIRRFENEAHKIRNTEIELRLDSLMYSLLVHEQDWKRWFDEDAAAPRKEHSESAGRQDEKKANILVDKVYAIAEKKWAEMGVTNTESKEDLAERICPIYMKALQEGQEVGFVYNKKTHRIQIKIKNGDTF